MALKTPSGSSAQDKFELDRLAEELSARESRISPKELPDTSDLPLFVPLSHADPYLSAPAFDVEAFLLSRLQHASLQDLRNELRDYLGSLKEELVQLINDDYEAFISLSTDLRGEGTRLEKLKYPLESLKENILESKKELQAIQDAIQSTLQKRTVLREEKALLHLLLKISEFVTRLESLLLIAPPENDPAAEVKMRPPFSGAEHEETDDNKNRGNRAKHLARAASEYTQLLYHASKARAEGCVFVDEIQWRIDRVQSTLSSDLDHVFTITLSTVSSGSGAGSSKATEAEKARAYADLAECLRTYDILGLWRDAEDVLRRELVRGFVKKTIYPGALAAPHSPLVPHTPMPITANPLAARTPFTPYFNSSSNSRTLANAPNAQYLPDQEDPLAHLYNQFLRFVERDLGRIMDAAERISVRPSPPSQETSQKAEGFQIMANVVWAEFGRAIMDELGNVIFAAGRPDEFRIHYEITQAFIRLLELRAPSASAVEAMRAHTVSAAFSRRWQLPVYFQLRWKEIISSLEDALAVTRVEPIATVAKDIAPFKILQTHAIWSSICTCWSPEVYIADLAPRFWKLAVQLLSRYKTWLDSSISLLDPIQKDVAAVASDKAQMSGSSSPISRISTPGAAPETSSADITAADDGLLRQYAAVIADICYLDEKVLRLWREQMTVMLPDIMEDEPTKDNKPEDALLEGLSRLKALITPLSTHIIGILTKRACDGLLPVRSIPSQFRAMANRRSPTEPSYFISSVLRPVSAFFGNTGPGADLKEFQKPWAEDVFENVCYRYIYYLNAMKKTEESLRRLKKGKKSGFSLFGSTTPAKEDEGRDEERIRTQMILDVNAFSKDAEALAIDVLNSDAYKALQELVHSYLVEES